MRRPPISFAPILLLLSLLASRHAAARSPSTLGQVAFAVTGTDAARGHFLRGLLALHSFWYDEARDEFRAATAAAPDFAMGYWGEALSFYHPVWDEEDAAATLAALASLPAKPKVTAREQAYLDAARLLGGDGSKGDDRRRRFLRYANAMRALHERFADDDEAATLYAVSLLGLIDPRDRSFSRQAEAAAIGLDVLARHPDHPGAAHYVIHAFDDPEHAILALPAARRYAQIAPESSHALHMPSHIFVQLGMWPEAEASNVASWAASVEAGRKKGIDVSYHDFHALGWLHSSYLEEGRRHAAESTMDKLRADRAATKEKQSAAWLDADGLMETARQTLALDDYAAIDALPNVMQPPVVAPPKATVAAPASAATKAASCHAAPPTSEHDARTANWGQAALAWMRGEAAIARKDTVGAAAAAAALAKLAPLIVGDSYWDEWTPRARQLDARVTALRGDVAGALVQLAAAADLEERTPPSGPVDGVSARERLGDLDLAHGRANEALAAYRRALALHPHRGRALLGAARAATAAHDPSAAGYWRDLGRVWAHADADWPGVAELRRAAGQ